MAWWSNPIKTGAADGKKDTPVTKSRWFDIGNARVGAEDKNRAHEAKKDAKRERRDEKVRNSEKKPFFY
jgi:predicted alpha/beta superfamily hydrolase